VFPPSPTKRILFWCPHLLEEIKVEVNLQPLFLIPFICKLYRYIQQMVENYEKHEEECTVAHLHIE
jgi:hypothetical protein